MGLLRIIVEAASSRVHGRVRLAALAMSGVLIVVWLVPLQPDSAPVAQLAHVFALTTAEARLLRCLADGEELRHTAVRLSISTHTTRNQLKSIFRKTGRRTQAQLLSLLSRLAALRSVP
jgi:DNA-binding CsgD family transcriptional regulator